MAPSYWLALPPLCTCLYWNLWFSLASCPGTLFQTSRARATSVGLGAYLAISAR